jgi:DNA replication initiation complex subunit (GINS family)
MLEKIVELLLDIKSELQKLNAKVASADVPAAPAEKKPKKEEPAPQPAPPAATAAPATAALAPPAVPEITREMVGTALVKLATEKGRDAAVAVLAKFNATKLDEITPAQYVGLATEIAGVLSL